MSTHNIHFHGQKRKISVIFSRKIAVSGAMGLQMQATVSLRKYFNLCRRWVITMERQCFLPGREED